MNQRLGDALMRITACFVLLMLILSPFATSAQPPTPAPSASTLVAQTSDAIQTLGVVTVVAVALAVICVLIVVFFVLVAYKGAAPLLNTIQTLLRSIRDGDQRLHSIDERWRETDTENARYRKLTTEIQEKMVKAMDEHLHALLQSTQTINEANNAGRAQLLKDVTSRIDAAETNLASDVKGVRELAERLLQEVEESKARLDDVLTKDELIEWLDEFTGKFNPDTLAVQVSAILEARKAPFAPTNLPDGIEPTADVGARHEAEKNGD